jgi:hypothetical protein
MTPYSFHVSKFKVTSECDGMVNTQFGDHKLATESMEIEFQEILLEDLTPEQVSELKSGTVLLLKFDNYSLNVPIKKPIKHSEETEYEAILSSDDLVEAHVVEIVDPSQSHEGSVVVKVECTHEFIFNGN